MDIAKICEALLVRMQANGEYGVIDYDCIKTRCHGGSGGMRLVSVYSA